MLFPNKTKYKKQFKGKLIGKTSKGSKIIFGKYAIKVLEETRLTARQIEATRRIIVRKMKRLGFLWIRVFPNTPITSKPTENRMKLEIQVEFAQQHRCNARILLRQFLVCSNGEFDIITSSHSIQN
jgi:ribosomal protein L16